MSQSMPHGSAVAGSDQAWVDTAQLAQRVAGGANWFYWIAGLSVINSVAVAFGAEWSFIVGLGMTQIVDAVARAIVEESGGSFLIWAALAVDVGIAGLFLLFGVLASKGKTAAFVVGMVLYGLDALLFVLVGDWLGLGFHVLALVFIFGGYSAARKLAAATPAPDPARSPQPITP